MDGHKFDDITKALAAGTTRRGVFKGMMGGALGGALSMMGLTRTAAQGAEKVGICHRTGSTTNPFVYIEVSKNAVPAHAAHGDLITCPDGGAPNPETCECDVVCELECQGNFVLDEADCACVCGIDETSCGDGHVFNPETCSCDLGDPGNQACQAFVCGTGVLCATRDLPYPQDSCACFELVENPGNGLCLGNFLCGSTDSCNADADCPEGWTCVTNTCCGQGVQYCAPPCPDPDTQAEGLWIQSVPDGNSATGQ